MAPTKLTEEDIRTEWLQTSPRAEADDDTTDGADDGADDDATDDAADEGDGADDDTTDS